MIQIQTVTLYDPDTDEVIKSTDKVAPIANSLFSAFSTLKMSLNGVKFQTLTGRLFSYKAYLDNLLTKSSDWSNSVGEGIGFFVDTIYQLQ